MVQNILNDCLKDMASHISHVPLAVSYFVYIL